MSQNTPVVISTEEKLKLSDFHKIFKADPKSVTPEMRSFVMGINDKAWLIDKDEKLPLAERVAAFDLIRMCHEILARNFQESWKPKEKGKGGPGQTYIASAEQRKQNCEAFKTYLGATFHALTPFEQAVALANVWGTWKT